MSGAIEWKILKIVDMNSLSAKTSLVQVQNMGKLTRIFEQ